MEYKGAAYSYEAMQAALSAYGMTTADMTVGSYAAATDAVKSLADRACDAAWTLSPRHMSWMKELCTAHDVVFIPLSQEALKKVNDTYPDWAFAGELPAGDYQGQDQDVPTIISRLSWVVHRDLPDDLVEQLLKYMFDPEYRADFEMAHATVKGEHTLARAVTNPFVPFHAGAVEYYKDKKVWTSELDKWQKDYLKELGEKR